MTKEKLVELIYKSLPYSEQIKELDFTSESDAIRFDWRGNRFRVADTLFVEEANNGTLAGSDLAIVIGELLKRVSMVTT